MAKTNEEFQATVDSLLKGMDAYLSTKTVVGEAIHIGDTIIIPLVNVSFGVGAGVFLKEGKNNGGGGLGGRMTPGAVLIIHNGTTRLINISTHTGLDKLLDLVPDFMERYRTDKEAKARHVDVSPEDRDQAREDMQEIIIEATADKDSK